MNRSMKTALYCQEDIETVVTWAPGNHGDLGATAMTPVSLLFSPSSSAGLGLCSSENHITSSADALFVLFPNYH